jgi:hypothetical protein
LLQALCLQFGRVLRYPLNERVPLDQGSKNTSIFHHRDVRTLTAKRISGLAQEYSICTMRGTQLRGYDGFSELPT